MAASLLTASPLLAQGKTPPEHSKAGRSQKATGNKSTTRDTSAAAATETGPVPPNDPATDNPQQTLIAIQRDLLNLQAQILEAQKNPPRRDIEPWWVWLSVCGVGVLYAFFWRQIRRTEIENSKADKNDETSRTLTQTQSELAQTKSKLEEIAEDLKNARAEAASLRTVLVRWAGDAWSGAQRKRDGS